MNEAFEVNFDGLVGPTHHFGGYAFGNLASMDHRKQLSYPKKAALQGLYKMKCVADSGVMQAVLPPRKRPSISTLRELGFEGNDREVIGQAARHAPFLLYSLSSASSMWAANAATISPSSDTADGRLHITLANLASFLHRSIEAEESYQLFKRLFPDKKLFAIHPPLPKATNFCDEGAANHIRFCSSYEKKGNHLFVYGKMLNEQHRAYHFPSRQTKEASEAIIRQHGLDPSRVLLVQQNPQIIDWGVFHNDVISTGNRNFFLYHEHAFIHTPYIIEKLQREFSLQTLCVTEKMLSAKEAVASYLFNGQILSPPNGEDLIILPQECARLNLNWLPIKKIFVDLKESMQNGGGPACLRLRCVMNHKELRAFHTPVLLTPSLYHLLEEWIKKHYRDRLSWHDLQDPMLFDEVETALMELAVILQLSDLYS